MIYLTSMYHMLFFAPEPLRQKADGSRLQKYAIVNVLVLGLIYGCAAALLGRHFLAGGETMVFNPLKIIVAGIPIAFFMHAGAALFVWVFFLAIGGKANFLSCYFHLGAAAISLWMAAPFAAALQAGVESKAIPFLTALFSLYALAVAVRVLQTAFGLSPLRTFIATGVTLAYIGSFLYLWV